MHDLETLSHNPQIWNDPQSATSLLKEQSKLKSEINSFDQLNERYNVCLELFQIADDSIMYDLNKDIESLYRDVQIKKTAFLFSRESDYFDCFLTIQSGAGGTESNDWAEMLLRMYTRWSEVYKGYKLELIDEVKGEEVGIKSAILKISGDMAYGWARTETGTHRLVRISPFNANAKRHTSFASVLVSPVVNDDVNIEINDKDIRIDTYRASGAGGQHVNKTDSAVRLTHIPTGIVVQCQSSRSQHRNRAEVFNMLRSRLYQVHVKEMQQKFESTEKSDIGWGHQIRSYVMQPYQIVKDNRTGFECGDINSVLNGDIDQFIIQALSREVSTSV